MSGARSRTKGHSFERHIVNKIKHLFPDIERVKAGDRLDLSGVDFRGSGRLLIQAKRNKSYASIRKIQEIKPTNGIPVLWTKGDREREIVCLYADDFIKILEDIGIVYE